eukprot:6174356-Pleurochrysis_carterae.AAC.4
MALRDHIGRGASNEAAFCLMRKSANWGALAKVSWLWHGAFGTTASRFRSTLATKCCELWVATFESAVYFAYPPPRTQHLHIQEALRTCKPPFPSVELARGTNYCQSLAPCARPLPRCVCVPHSTTHMVSTSAAVCAG